jgi:flagellar protein FliS
LALQNPYNNYKQNSIMTVSPEELVVLMYKGLEKFVKQGILFVEEKNIEKANNAILRAQDIIYELMTSLDMNIGVAHQLHSLYDFLINKLVEANLKKDAQKLQEALEIVTGLKEAWEGALSQVRQLKYGK